MKSRISPIICLLLASSWAMQASAAVPVLLDDDFSSVPITNTLGGVAGDATQNDSLSGTPNPDANTTLTLINDGGSGATLDANGNIHVPAGTAAGSYTLTYQSCDAAVPADCATATAMITVHEEPFVNQQCTVVDETVPVGVCGEWDEFTAAQNPWPVTPSGPGCSTWNRVSFTPDIVEPIVGLIGTNYLGVVPSPAGGNYLGMAADAGNNEAVTVNLHSLIPGETYRVSFTYINSGRRASERDPAFVRMTMPGAALPIGTPELSYDPNTWHDFNATFVAAATSGPLILSADNSDPQYESAVGVDAIRVTRVRCVEPPTASDDSRTGATQGTAVTIQVIDNDNDPENDIDPSTVNITTPGATDSDNDGDMDTLTVPGEGVWTVDNTTGAITFTPFAGFTGNPTPIQYNVRDATGLISNTVTVTITYVPATGVAAGIPTLSGMAMLLLAILLMVSVYRTRYHRKAS